MSLPTRLALAVSSLFVLPAALAAQPVQKVKPPVSQAFIDLATFSGGVPLPGGMFGARNDGNSFGMTQSQSPGRWMDVTLLTRNNAKLTTATHSLPAGARLGPALNLLAPEGAPVEASAPDDTPEPVKFEMPKGKMYLYWGCGTEVRKGQPLVLDLARMDPAQMSKFFQNRSAASRVARPAPGRPAWPNRNDARRLPDGASMVGEHAFAGDGVADGFRFNIGARHDLMPAVEAGRMEEEKSVLFKWKPMVQASGWFVQAMGMREAGKGAEGAGGEMEVVYWTSSELPDMGMGLVNYQPNGSVSKWQKEKVLLPAAATECAAPKEAVGAMSMSRVIAYGEELNTVYPPRPKDPKIAWEPQWDVKVRLKSVASLMPGMDGAMQAAMAGQGPAPEAPPAPAPAGGVVKEAVTRGVVDSLVRGLFKR